MRRALRLFFSNVISKWYWLNNMDSIISVVSFGRFVRNRMLFGNSGTTTAGWTVAGMTVEQNIATCYRRNYYFQSISKEM